MNALHPDLFPLRVVVESSLWLAVALFLERGIARSSRAHAVLACGLAASLLALFLGILCRTFGWGLLPGVFQDVVPLAPPVAGGLDAGAASSRSLEWGTFLVFAWCVASALLSLRLAVAAWRGRRRLRRAREVGCGRSELARCARELSTELGLRRVPCVRVSKEVAGPAVWGLSARATVLLPPALAAWDARSLEPILRHELAHVRRRDHGTSLLADAACIALPWNPLAWIARSRLAERAEEACDAWALAGPTPPVEYARLLVKLLPGPRRELALSVSGTRRRVERRLGAVLAHDGGAGFEPRAGRTLLALTACVGALGASALGLAQERPSASADRPAIAVLDAAWNLGGVRSIPAEVSLDPVPAGGDAHGVVWIANLDDAPIEVIAVRPSCGCTTVRAFAPTSLLPGEALALELSIEAPAEHGVTKEKSLAVRIKGADDLLIPIRVSTLPG